MKTYTYSEDWEYLEKKAQIDAEKFNAVVDKIAEFGFVLSNFTPSFAQNLPFYDDTQKAAYRAFPFSYQQAQHIRKGIEEKGTANIQEKTKKRVEVFLATYGNQTGNYPIPTQTTKDRYPAKRPSISTRVQLTAEETALFSSLIGKYRQASTPPPAKSIAHIRRNLIEYARYKVGAEVPVKWAEWLRGFQQEVQEQPTKNKQ